MVALLLLAGARPISAQRYSFQSYRPEQGLANASIGALFQDQAGFLWVGTQNGLFRYDGDRFRPYGRGDGLPSSYILAIGQAADGPLWVGTWTGLAYSRDGRFEYLDVGEPVNATALSFDSRGRLFAATDHGLIRVDRSQGLAPPRFVWVSRTPAHSVHVMPDDSVWFGCGTGLCRVGLSGLEVLGPERYLPSTRWTSIALDGHGSVWVSSMDHVCFLPHGARMFAPGPEGLPEGGIQGSNLYVSADGGILATTAAGLAMLHGGRWRIIGVREGLPPGQITSVIQDREGSIWIGFIGTGLVRWLGYKEWESWTTAEGLSDPIVWATARDSQGRLWVGPNRGLNRLELSAGRSSVRRVNPELAGLPITGLGIGPDRSIWATSGDGSMLQIDRDGRPSTSYGPADGLTSSKLYSLAFDPENRVWAAGLGGVFRSYALRHGVRARFEKVDVPGLGSEGHLYQVFRNHRGQIWLPTPAGLLCWQGRAGRNMTWRTACASMLPTWSRRRVMTRIGWSTRSRGAFRA